MNSAKISKKKKGRSKIVKSIKDGVDIDLEEDHDNNTKNESVSVHTEKSKERTRKVLSFDVGIKNLAYCLMEINDDTQRFKIEDWKIINLADNRMICSFIKRSGEFCDKVANRVVKVNKRN